MAVFKLIIGLGNPGAEYQKTRHNAGFWFVESLLKESAGAALVLQTKFKALVGEINVTGTSRKIYLAQPQTFMNKSGESALAIAQFYKILPQEILVVHDELDLAPGTIRLKQGGGHGGHNGLKSLISHLGSNEFSRLRVGIGHPGHALEVANYVLKKASSDDQVAMEQAIGRALYLKNELLNDQLDFVMNRLHQS